MWSLHRHHRHREKQPAQASASLSHTSGSPSLSLSLIYSASTGAAPRVLCKLSLAPPWRGGEAAAKDGDGGPEGTRRTSPFSPGTGQDARPWEGSKGPESHGRDSSGRQPDSSLGSLHFIKIPEVYPPLKQSDWNSRPTQVFFRPPFHTWVFPN